MIRVFNRPNDKQFPIRLEISYSVDQEFTIKAAIELRRKLDTAIGNHQVFEAKPKANMAVKHWDTCNILKGGNCNCAHISKET